VIGKSQIKSLLSSPKYLSTKATIYPGKSQS